jgi:hypothetical protein
MASGSAAVFGKGATGAWLQSATLVAADASPGDLVGQAVSLAGDRGLAGAVSDEDRGEGRRFGHRAGLPSRRRLSLSIGRQNIVPLRTLPLDAQNQ